MSKLKNTFLKLFFEVFKFVVGPFKKENNTFNWWFYRKYSINRLKCMSDEEFNNHVRKELWELSTKKHKMGQ
jgi:hypothetical protein